MEKEKGRELERERERAKKRERESDAEVVVLRDGELAQEGMWLRKWRGSRERTMARWDCCFSRIVATRPLD
jgi:hypothetical protein